MRKFMVLLVAVLACLMFSFSSSAQKIDTSKHLGIGLQANYPLLGGISVRYYGLSPVYLQVVGRFIMNGDERDNMLGAGVSYAVFEHVSSAITRLYFSLEGGGRYERTESYYWDFEESVTSFTTKKTYGLGVVFGVEFVTPFAGTQLGCNAEIGQGFGRIDEEGSKLKDTASFILGFGFHVYF